MNSVNGLLTTQVFIFYYPSSQLKAEEERYKTEVLKLESRKLDISLAIEKRQTSPPAGTFAASHSSRLFSLFFLFFIWSYLDTPTTIGKDIFCYCSFFAILCAHFHPRGS